MYSNEKNKKLESFKGVYIQAILWNKRMMNKSKNLILCRFYLACFFVFLKYLKINMGGEKIKKVTKDKKYK